MAITNHERVGKVLNLLKDGLRPFVEWELKAQYQQVGRSDQAPVNYPALRHALATMFVQNGVDLYKVKELRGHKTLAMTAHYSHHCPESLGSSVEVLDRCYNFTTVGASAD